MTLKICVLFCSNSLEARELEDYIDKIHDVDFNLISLPCSGKVDIPYMVKAFETGADGVLVVTCPQGECRNIEGNLRAQKRVLAVDSLNEEIGLGHGRIKVIQLKQDDKKQIVNEIEEFISMNMEKTT
jgi:coenzyme F420-reducing hydrogenase delta subunit